MGLRGAVAAVGIVVAVAGCGSQTELRVTVPVRLKYPSVTPLPAGTRNIAIPAFAAVSHWPTGRRGWGLRGRHADPARSLTG